MSQLDYPFGSLLYDTQENNPEVKPQKVSGSYSPYGVKSKSLKKSARVLERLFSSSFEIIGKYAQI
jgi:hypothetical protein